MATIPQNIQSFYAVAQQQDFARVFQFRLLQLGADDTIGGENLIYAETASLPGRQINNIPVPYMGLSFNVPGTASYPGSAGYNITFRCDQNYNLRDKLEALNFGTFSDASSTGNYATPSDSSVIGLGLYGKGGNLVRYYTLYGAYVQALADQGYDIKDTGTVATIQATIAYQFWRVSNMGNEDQSARTLPNAPQGRVEEASEVTDVTTFS
jgi:hypothetical protein